MTDEAGIIWYTTDQCTI